MRSYASISLGVPPREIPTSLDFQDSRCPLFSNDPLALQLGNTFFGKSKISEYLTSVATYLRWHGWPGQRRSFNMKGRTDKVELVATVISNLDLQTAGLGLVMSK